jgi:hypothetical protein
MNVSPLTFTRTAPSPLRASVIRNLGAFDHSMIDEYFDDGLREAFLDAYIGSDFKGNRASFCRRVKSRSAVLSGRRHKPKY